jgi:thioesterase domain-containing protein
MQSGKPDDLYVLLAPGGGSCSSYLTLAEHLPSDATIVVFDHPKFHVLNATEYSIESLAELYAADLQSSFAPMRRCSLIGASFGGLVAVAMLQLLLQTDIHI